MIAFLVRSGAADPQADARAEAAIGQWRARHLLFPAGEVRQWTAPDGLARCWWVAHPAHYLGGVHYTAADGDAFALFSGHPVTWREGEADGREGLDARLYLQPAPQWSARMDGRYAVVRIDRDGVAVQTDAAGMQQLYEHREPGVTWLSNLAPLVAPERGPGRTRALAAVLGAGWGMTGEPLDERVGALAPDTLLHLAPDGTRRQRRVHGPVAGYFAAEPDYDEAARVLVSFSRALADWPGRPAHLGVSGGWDSRLVAAAMSRAKTGPAAFTIAYAFQPGFPATEDVVLGRRVATALGLEHQTRCHDSTAVLYREPAWVGSLLGLTAPGTTALHDVSSLLTDPVHVPLALIFSGIGGEIGRGTFYRYGQGATVRDAAEAILRHVVPADPAPLVNDHGYGLLRRWTENWITEQCDQGVRLEDVADVAFLHRLGTWFGTNASTYEHSEDAATPLVSPRLWPHMLGQSLDDRRAQRFQHEVLRRLGPELLHLPFDSANSGPTNSGPTDAPVPPPPTARDDALPAVQGLARGAVDREPGHPAWELLDRDRVRAVLTAPPGEFDFHARLQLWRLATVFELTPN